MSRVPFAEGLPFSATSDSGEIAVAAIETAMPIGQSYAGRTFGRITLASPVPGKSGYWAGTCSCGNRVEKRIDNLKRPGNHSCGRCPAPSSCQPVEFELRVRRLEEAVFSGRLSSPVPVSSAVEREWIEDQPGGLGVSEARVTPPAVSESVGHFRKATEEPGQRPRRRLYPIPPGHCLHRDFWYFEDPEGLELETSVDGGVHFLDFHPTIAEVREAIKMFLYDRGYLQWVVEGIWSEGPSGDGA